MQQLLFPSFWEARGLILSRQVSSKALLSPPGISQAFTNLLVQLGGKRLELLKEAAPKIVSVAAPYVLENRTHGLELKSAKAAAHALGITIQPREVRGGDDFDRVFDSMSKQRPRWASRSWWPRNAGQ